MKQECLEMNKMEPATNINLPPTLQLDCHRHNQCVFFYILVFYYHFSSHSWYAWSCLPQSSQHWSKPKSSPVCDCTTAAHAKKQSTLRKGRVWCGRTNGCRYGCWRATVSVQLAAKRHMVFLTRLLPAFPSEAVQAQYGCPATVASLFLVCGFLLFFYFLILTWETVVYCILGLASFPAGRYGHDIIQMSFSHWMAELTHTHFSSCVHGLSGIVKLCQCKV